MEDTNRIKFALYLKGWRFGADDKRYLRQHARRPMVTEYTPDMKGYIFCPECCSGLSRSPEEKDFFSNGRRAFYRHTSSEGPACNLRVKQKEGKRYVNEEAARQAIEDGELVVVSAFMREKPVPPVMDGPLPYQGEVVEDQNGGITQVAIGRHNGETFPLPSRITTMRGLCRNFDQNLMRYFHLPRYQYALLLQDLLINVMDVTEPCDEPKLYYGRVLRSWPCGKTLKNIRQTKFQYRSVNEYVDFCLKATDEICQEHGVDDNAAEKIVLMYGKVTISGLGLCIERVGWGEIAVLPPKYVSLLE